MLWSLRYKKGIGGVTTTLVEKKQDSFATAQAVGQAWCEQAPGTRYIGIEKAIVADEAILRTPEGEKAGKVPTRVGA